MYRAVVMLEYKNVRFVASCNVSFFFFFCALMFCLLFLSNKMFSHAADYRIPRSVPKLKKINKQIMSLCCIHASFYYKLNE